MKVLSIAATLVLLGPSSGSSLRDVTDDVDGNFRHGVITKERSEGIALADETPKDVLHSGVCKEYIDNAYKEVVKIIDNEPEGAISNYLCSHISLTLAADKVKEAKKAVAVEQNPCAKALKESWAEAEESINLYMESSEKCHAEVGKQIADSKGGGSVNSYVRVDEEEGWFGTLVVIACIAWCW